MSTRSFIATRSDGGLTGRYHHWDGYPTALAATLLRLVETAELPAMRKVLLEDHPAGFSTINHASTLADFAGAGFTEGMTARMNGERATVECYCHGDRAEAEQSILCRCEVGDASHCDPLFLEWGYVLDDAGLTVYKSVQTGEVKTVEAPHGSYEQPGYVHLAVGQIPWDTEDPAADVEAMEEVGTAMAEAAYEAVQRQAAQ